MGNPRGIGYDGVGNQTRAGIPKNLLGKNPFAKTDAPTPTPAASPVIRLLIRWESALPIRVAELKARETAAQASSDDGYSIAVYGIPGTFFGDPKSLGSSLKGFAALKRVGKKELKPSSVEVFQLEGGAAVLYLFPKAPDIAKSDGVVEFTALIGRLQLSQTFQLDEMEFQDKLEL
jgi:hypothetical protein